MTRHSKRHHRKKTYINWSIEEDCLLIENNHLEMKELVILLPYTEDEIIDRKKNLGLFLRDKYLNKLED